MADAAALCWRDRVKLNPSVTATRAIG